MKLRTNPARVRLALAYYDLHGFRPTMRQFDLSSRSLVRWIEAREEHGPEWPTLDMDREWIATRDHREHRSANLRRWRARSYINRGSLLVDSLGTSRRIHALMAIGWTAAGIAAHGPWATGDALLELAKRPRVHIDNRDAVARIYDQLCMTPGPSDHTRRRALAKGWAPPLAWDDIDLDTKPSALCAVDDCPRPLSRRGWCEMHYRRWQRSGTTTGTGKTGRPRGDDASYNAVHLRLGRERGKAREHSCSCGREAQTWSYDHGDSAALLDERGRPYSTDLDHYQPLCVPCHNRRDKQAKRDREAADDQDFDPVVVDRLLTGNRVPSTRADKVEAMRRWMATGRSQRSLCRVHGWQESRYVERQDGAA